MIARTKKGWLSMDNILGFLRSAFGWASHGSTSKPAPDLISIATVRAANARMMYPDMVKPRCPRSAHIIKGDIREAGQRAMRDMFTERQPD